MVYFPGGATEFVDQLWTRWQERRPRKLAAAAGPVLRDIPENAIFISYAHQDSAAAQVLKAGLEAAGLPVWFDERSLKAGDGFNSLIERVYHVQMLLFRCDHLQKYRTSKRRVLSARVELGCRSRSRDRS